jgi:2-methylaconitate cis-trans-isomerase PrpF
MRASRAGSPLRTVRLLFMNRLHESIAGTGSICLAAAA